MRMSLPCEAQNTSMSTNAIGRRGRKGGECAVGRRWRLLFHLAPQADQAVSPTRAHAARNRHFRFPCIVLGTLPRMRPASRVRAIDDFQRDAIVQGARLEGEHCDRRVRERQTDDAPADIDGLGLVQLLLVTSCPWSPSSYLNESWLPSFLGS